MQVAPEFLSLVTDQLFSQTVQDHPSKLFYLGKLQLMLLDKQRLPKT